MLSLRKLAVKTGAESPANVEKRLSQRLPIRRLNVDIAGSPIHTANVSKVGAQLVCPAMRFPSLEKHLKRDPVEMVVELPTGRKMAILVGLRYVCESDDEILIGVEFKAFRGQDERGWHAYLDWVTNAAALRRQRVS